MFLQIQLRLRLDLHTKRYSVVVSMLFVLSKLGFSCSLGYISPSVREIHQLLASQSHLCTHLTWQNVSVSPGCFVSTHPALSRLCNEQRLERKAFGELWQMFSPPASIFYIKSMLKAWAPQWNGRINILQLNYICCSISHLHKQIYRATGKGFKTNTNMHFWVQSHHKNNSFVLV